MGSGSTSAGGVRRSASPARLGFRYFWRHDSKRLRGRRRLAGPRQRPHATRSARRRAKGRADAPVTLYEMSDFQCPYCREFAMSTMPVLEREYIEPGKVRFVYINLPLSSVHRNAASAAEVAMCAARQKRFWPMHDLRSEEHTSELQSRLHLVCRLLL